MKRIIHTAMWLIPLLVVAVGYIALWIDQPAMAFVLHGTAIGFFVLAVLVGWISELWEWSKK
jgi:hypothetical protein